MIYANVEVASVMKPLSARWLIDMHKYFVDHPSIIVNGRMQFKR